MKTSNLLSVREIAQHLGVAERTIYDWVHQRKIPALKLGDSRNSPVRFDPDAIDRWLKDRQLKAVA